MKSPASAHMWSIVLVLPSLLAVLQTTTATKVAVPTGASVYVWYEPGKERTHLGSWGSASGCASISIGMCAGQCVCKDLVLTSHQALPRGPYHFLHLTEGVTLFLPLYR